LAIRRARNLLLRTIDTPVVVLLYHRVAALASDPQQLAVSPDNFREQMVYLKKRYPLVRFEEDWSRVKSLTIAVTFDDGYADNFLNALPILEEVGIPATFFVSTGNLDTEYEYWWDELERIILGDLHLPENFSLDDNGLARRWLTDNFAAREEFYAEFQPLMKNLVVERREEWLELLRQWSGAGVAGRRDYRAMTREELQHLARAACRHSPSISKARRFILPKASWSPCLEKPSRPSPIPTAEKMTITRSQFVSVAKRVF
jgi:hypothetical protein